MSQDGKERAGVFPARQARSEKTRDALLTSLERLLRKKRFEDISVAEIAAGADVSVGAVYRRFANKDAFIPVLFELYRDRLEATYGETGGLAIDGEASLRDTLRDIARRGLAFLVAEAPLARAAHLYGRLRPDLVGEEWESLMNASVAGFIALVEHFSDEVKRSDVRRAGEYLAYHFNTALLEKALYPLEGMGAAISAPDEDFADAMADFAWAYLTTEDA